MNLKPELLTTMDALGVTADELAVLQARMLSAVTGLQAQLSALNSQIGQLTAQRAAVETELQAALVTVGKLTVETPQEPPQG